MIAAETTSKLHVWTRDEIIATWRAVLVNVYRVETTMGGAETVQQVFDELTGRYPAGAFILTVVEEAAPIPAPDVRAKLARFLATRAPQIVLSAVVYEGSGFRAAAVRSIVTGLALVSKLPYRHKIFSTVSDAARWFCANAPQATGWGELELIEAVAQIRRPEGRS